LDVKLVQFRQESLANAKVSARPPIRRNSLNQSINQSINLYSTEAQCF